MDSLMLVASVFGPFQLIMGLWTLVHRQNVHTIIDSFKKTAAAVYVMGWISMLLGLAIIYAYNFWNFSSVTIFVTLLGWGYFLRGLLILFVPRIFVKGAANESSMITLGGVLRLVFGVALSWIAMQ